MRAVYIPWPTGPLPGQRQRRAPAVRRHRRYDPEPPGVSAPIRGQHVERDERPDQPNAAETQGDERLVAPRAHPVESILIQHDRVPDERDLGGVLAAIVGLDRRGIRVEPAVRVRGCLLYTS